MGKLKFLLAYCLTASHFRSLTAFSSPSTILSRHRVVSRLQNQPEHEVDVKFDIEEAVNNIELYDEASELSWKDPKVLETIEEELDDDQLEEDERYMREAIKMAKSLGGERSELSAYPNPTVGAVLVSYDGRILGKGRSDYSTDAVRAVMKDAGLEVIPLKEWLVSWPSSAKLREDLVSSTLYLTLEPSSRRQGTAMPPLTQLITEAGIPRVVIGCPDPVPERASKAASLLHMAGIEVSMGTVLREECEDLIKMYSDLANSKLQRMSRKHFKLFGRPLGFLHCSVVDSDNVEAFARHGNAFGTNFGGKNLSYRNFGAYEIAPPPEVIWAADDDEDYGDTFMDVDFEDEEQQTMSSSPMMPWYEKVDAVAVTLPSPGNGPADDDSLTARLNGLKWLATHGNALPPGVERIVVLDATDLKELPLSNKEPSLPRGVDVEEFWKAEGRKPTRVLLRRGTNAQARAAAEAAAAAAAEAAKAAQVAAAAIESGDAARAAEAAIECQKSAQTASEFILKELQSTQDLKNKLEALGVIVETMEGGEPIDVMKHLGKRNGLHTVLWRGGCWKERGVKSIMAGAFQWVSAHLAVDAVGGRFWQLMLAENAVQAACGPQSKVKIFSDQDNISLEYCDEPEVDDDCALTIGGRPVRHVRIDCRVALVDENRTREFSIAKTRKIDKRIIEEQAPWFM